MLLTLRSQGVRSPRAIADSIISALSPAAWYRNATDVVSSGGFASIWADYASSDVGLVLPNVINNYASASDSVPLSVTGDIDISCFVSLTDWTPAAEQTFVSKYSGVGNQRSWIFSVQTSGALRLYQSLDGVAQTNVLSSVAPTVSDGDALWVRVTRASATGAVKFYTGGSGTSPSWAQLGIDRSLTSGDLFDSSAAVQVGAWDGSSQAVGTIYRAIIKDGIDGTTVFDADFSAQSIGTTSFTESSSNAATVTVNQSGALPAHIGNKKDLLQGTGTNQPAYSNGVMTGDGLDNFMKIVADAAIVQPITIYWVGKQVTWTNADYFFDGNSSNSGGLYQNSSTPRFNLYAGAALGVNTNLAVNTRGVVCAVINNTSSSTRVNDTAKVSGTAGTANMGGFCLFSIGAGNNGWSNTAVEEVVIFLAAHDDATQSSVITALNNALTVF